LSRSFLKTISCAVSGEAWCAAFLTSPVKRWSEWFTADLKQIAAKRLDEAGYDEPEPKYLWNRHAKKRSPLG
jgi:hypothetical protein